MYDPIYCSDLRKPYTYLEYQAQQVGTIYIPKMIKKGEEYEVEFYFGGTTIKVHLRDTNGNPISRTIIKYQTNL